MRSKASSTLNHNKHLGTENSPFCTPVSWSWETGEAMWVNILPKAASQWNSGTTWESNPGPQVLIPSVLTTRLLSHTVVTFLSSASILLKKSSLLGSSVVDGGLWSSVVDGGLLVVVWSQLYVLESFVLLSRTDSNSPESNDDAGEDFELNQDFCSDTQITSQFNNSCLFVSKFVKIRQFYKISFGHFRALGPFDWLFWCSTLISSCNVKNW